jgi:hypothetical protein
MNANQRYLRALSAAPLKGKRVAALDALCRPRTTHGRRVARFSPLNPTDLALFKAAIAGSTTSSGSATPTPPDVSTADRPSIATRPTGDANASHASPSNSEATA